MMTHETDESFAERVKAATGMDLSAIDESACGRDALFPILCARSTPVHHEYVVDLREAIHPYGGDVQYMHVVVPRA